MNDEGKTKKELIAELKRLREELDVLRTSSTGPRDEKASDRKFVNVIGSIPVGIHMYELRHDGELIFIGANPAADRILGVDNSQFTGKTIEEAFPPLVTTEIPRRYRETALSGAPWSTEQITYRYERIAGAFEVHAFQIEPRIMAAAFFDVTSRKKQEESMQRSERRARSIFEDSPVSLWVEDASVIKMHLLDLESRGIDDLEEYLRSDPGRIIECVSLLKVIDVNKASLQMFGAENREDLIENLPATFNERSLNIFVKIVLGLYRKSMSFEYETEFLTLKGEKINGIVRAVVMPGCEENLERILVTITDITPIRSAEESLIASNERLKILISEMPAACIVWDRKLRVEIWNPGAEDIFGFSADEALGRPLNDLIVASLFRDEASVVMKQVLDGGQPVHSVHENVTRDGTFIMCEWHSTPVRDREGKVMGVISIALDITERRKNEESLRESEERFRTLFDSALDGVLVADLREKKFLMGNPAIYEMLGYGPDEIKSMGVGDIHPRDSLPHVVEQFEKQAKGEIRLAGNIPVLRKDGTVFYADISSFPITLEGRMYLAGFFRDITERKNAEDRLQAERDRAKDEKARVESILEGIGDGICILDREFRIVYQNAIHKRLLGDYFGEQCYRVFEKRGNVCDGCPVSKTFADGRVHLTGRMRIENGEKRYFEINTSPLRNARGDITEVIEVVRDVTERRSIEQEVLKLQKLESLGVLAGGIAHDFNNLLQGLLGNITYAKMHTEKDSKVYQVLDQAESAYNLAQNLTNQLLTFASGGVPVRKPMMLGPIVKDAVLFTLSGASIVPVFRIQEGCCLADIDEGQMRQVIQNIVLNAKDAMPEGGTLDVEVERAENGPAGGDAGKRVRISITDHGVGMGKEQTDKIFEPYFTTKEMGARKGMGLGLTICYSIVKNHDGHIQVSSIEGKGTTFTIYLPITDREPDAVPSTAHFRKEAYSRKRVLIMDDEKIVTDIAGQFLDHLGYDVEIARDGVETIGKYQASMVSAPFDLVILDLTIPGGMGGKETLKQLYEIDPGVKVVASSGYSTDPLITDYIDAGFKGVLIKPYRLETMEETLAKILEDGC